MAKLPTIKTPDFIKFLEFIGFEIVRQKGSHIRLKSSDGRVTTVSVNGVRPVPKGLDKRLFHLSDFL